MKRLNLDQTWIQCLKMWKWIAEEVRRLDRLNKMWDVNALKEQWLNENGFGAINEECFFCEYAIKARNRSIKGWDTICPYCPAEKVDSSFSCTRDGHDYKYEPLNFLEELLRLNKIRLGKK